MITPNYNLPFASKKIEAMYRKAVELGNDLYLKSKLENILEKFALYSKFEIDTSEQEDYDENVGLAIYTAIGPIQIDDKYVLLTEIDERTKRIEELGDFFDDLPGMNLTNAEEKLKVEEEAKSKWEELKMLVNDLFEDVVSANKKQEYLKIIEELDKIEN